jgi:hypothetical protein
MEDSDIAATIRSLSTPELVTTLQRLHDKKGYLTEITNWNKQTLLYYKQTKDQNDPSGVIWILGDENPTKRHLSRLNELQRKTDTNHSAIALTVEPDTQPLDSLSELLTPSRLADIISSLETPQTVFPSSTPSAENKPKPPKGSLKIVRSGTNLDIWSSSTTPPKSHPTVQDTYWDKTFSQ